MPFVNHLVTFPPYSSCKSPGAIIKAIQKIDQDIMAAVRDAAPTNEEQEMEFDLPAIQEERKVEGKAVATAPVNEMEDVSSATSTADSDDMMDPTDVEEDSVNITATSNISRASANISRASAKAVADVTGCDGKLDISKIKDWSIPKIKDLDPSLHDSFISGRTRRQLVTSTSASNASSSLSPQARSTPHPSRANKSHLMDRVRSNLNPAK